MTFISATRLRVKSFIYLPAFFMANEASSKQLIKTPGFLGGKELVDKHFTFWTLTLWRDISDMKAFRNSLPHRKAMQKLPKLCDEASYVHWTQNDSEFIDWIIVYARLTEEGKLTKVKNPSRQQLTKTFPPPKWTRLERTFKSSF